MSITYTQRGFSSLLTSTYVVKVDVEEAGGDDDQSRSTTSLVLVEGLCRCAFDVWHSRLSIRKESLLLGDKEVRGECKALPVRGWAYDSQLISVQRRCRERQLTQTSEWSMPVLTLALEAKAPACT